MTPTAPIPMFVNAITRRAFLGLIGQASAYIVLAQNHHIHNKSTSHSTGSGSAYGQGSYSRGRYPGFQLHFPLIRKEIPSHGSPTHPQQ